MSDFLQSLLSRYPKVKNLENSIISSFDIIKNAYKKDNTLFVCGNGGSASDSEHIVGELMKGFLKKRTVKEGEFKNNVISLFEEDSKLLLDNLQDGLRAISLMSHPSLFSAFSNDVNSELVFAQQLYVLGRAGDVLIAISTSGNSKNIYRAIEVAKAKNISVVLLTGEEGGICAKKADISIKAPSSMTYMIQEYHVAIYHTLCLMLEDYFYEC